MEAAKVIFIIKYIQVGLKYVEAENRKDGLWLNRVIASTNLPAIFIATQFSEIAEMKFHHCLPIIKYSNFRYSKNDSKYPLGTPQSEAKGKGEGER